MFVWSLTGEQRKANDDGSGNLKSVSFGNTITKSAIRYWIFRSPSASQTSFVHVNMPYLSGDLP